MVYHRCHFLRGGRPAGWGRWAGALVLCLLLVGQAMGQFGADAGGGNPVAGSPLVTPRQKGALIKLYGPVDAVMLQSLKRRVDAARKENCDVIIYELDTYGGLLPAALDISRYTKALGRDIPVIAYVHSRAISSGMIIAAACSHIVVAPDASMGDCAPIAVESGRRRAFGGNAAADMTSPVLDDLRDSADKNHLNELLLRAMVVREVEVWVIRNNLDMKEPPQYVEGTEKERKLAELNKLPNGGHGNTWILDAKPLDDDKSLLTVSATEAVDLGLARGMVDSDLQLRSVCNLRGDLVPLDYNWSEEVVRWLSSASVRFGLFILMLVLAYVEFSHPGTALGGIGALICLGLLVGAPYLTGLAQVWEIVLIALGAAIIAGDLLLYGGVGLLAVPGFILMAIGLVASFVPTDPGGGLVPTMPQFYSGLQRGLSVVVFGSLTSIGIFYLLSRYLYMTPGFRRLQLAPAAVGPAQSGVRDAIDRPATDAVFVGALGQAVSDLRPAGKARFDSFLIDVTSEAQFIPHGTTVVVIEAAGNRVVVKPQAPTRGAELPAMTEFATPEDFPLGPPREGAPGAGEGAT